MPEKKVKSVKFPRKLKIICCGCPEKIPSTSNLVTVSVLNTKIDEVENKIPNVSGLVTKNRLWC